MKRTPMKRGRKSVKRRNGPRAKARYARNFGDEADAVRAMPCLITGTTPSEPAHVVSRGAGGGRFDIIPLSPAMHAQQHSVGVQSFAAAHRLDLRAEADGVALSHAAPLGLRGLAQRWAAANAEIDRCKIDMAIATFDFAKLDFARGPARMADVASRMRAIQQLDDYEREALLGWVRRRMEAEVAVARRQRDDESFAWGFATITVGYLLGLRTPEAEALCDVAGWENIALAEWPS